MRTPRILSVVPAVAVMLGAVSSASAQLSLGGMNLEGEISAGPRFYLDEPSKSSKAKWEEYRDQTQGLHLEELDLRLFRPDEGYSVELSGSKWGYDDQAFELRAGRLGRWEFGFEWDQTKHVLATSGRMLATEISRGVFALPGAPAAIPFAAYLQAPEIDEISVRWDTAKILFKLTPTPDLELNAEYVRIQKEGDRPMGVAFGSPGNNFMEVLQPIEHTIHDFRVKGILARENWQLQFGYDLSVFYNELDRVLVDNPCFLNAGACGAGDGGAAAPQRGQMSLPPDNQAHTFNLAGGVNLPMRTRVNVGTTYSMRIQNDELLPHTVNPAVVTPDLGLPEHFRHGLVHVLLFNLGATSRPLPRLTLSGNYRFYGEWDESDHIVFQKLVQNDRTILGKRRTGQEDYRRHNLDLGARVRVLRPLTVGVGAGWERWDRNENAREVPRSDELFGKLTVDYTPFDWVLVRAAYRPSYRRIEQYNTGAHQAHAVEEGGTVTAAQSLLLRKFDEGERDRHRADLTVQLAPAEALTVTPMVGYRYDDYVMSQLGLQEEEAWSAGIDVAWNPSERLGVNAGYVRERSFAQQRSRYRPIVGAAALVDVKDFEWISENVDVTDTAYAKLRAGLVPRMLDLVLGANYATSVGSMNTKNPVFPFAPAAGAANTATARAEKFPKFWDELIRVDAALKYHFLKSWTAKLAYAWESFVSHDWRTDPLVPVLPGVTSIWLGNDAQNYDAHVIGLTLSYHFGK